MGPRIEPVQALVDRVYDIPAGMCLKCGADQKHVKESDCISFWRDKVALLEFRVVNLQRKLENHPPGGRPSREMLRRLKQKSSSA